MKLTKGEKKLQELEMSLKGSKTESKRPKPVRSTKSSDAHKVGLKRLFFDIETSPNVVYTWNIGYNLVIGHDNIITERAVICISYKWEHENKVHNLTWDKGNDKAMILAFNDIIQQADEVIGHNGDNYDMKWFRTRAIYHGIKNMPKFKTIDTLKVARKNFRFNSNKLDYIAQYLGLGKKVSTGGFDLWKQVLSGDASALKKMVYYCDNDVLLLEKVFNKLDGYSDAKTHVGVLIGKDTCSCPKCGHDHSIGKGNIYTASGLTKKARECKKCGHRFNISLTAFEKLQE